MVSVAKCEIASTDAVRSQTRKVDNLYETWGYITSIVICKIPYWKLDLQIFMTCVLRNKQLLMGEMDPEVPVSKHPTLRRLCTIDIMWGIGQGRLASSPGVPVPWTVVDCPGWYRCPVVHPPFQSGNVPCKRRMNPTLNFGLDLSLPPINLSVHPVDAILMPKARATNWQRWYQMVYYQSRKASRSRSETAWGVDQTKFVIREYCDRWIV